MAFQLPELPFAKHALAPHMSAETLEYHHGKHHRTYVEKSNDLIGEMPALAGASLVKVVKAAHAKGETKLFNNSAQLWNHNFFWQCLAPAQGQKPSGKLLALMEQEFGDTATMLKTLAEEGANHFSNGWAWLLLDRGKLKIASLHDADTPLVHDGMTPLFTLDVWEHAYYIDYRNERPKFAEAVLSNIVNWDFVAQNLDGQGAKRADQDGAIAQHLESVDA
jgi:Fe-Mn family superoxide dismutase